MLRKEYRRYDPRLKNLVAKSEDISRFVALGIPRSTLRQWQLGGPLKFFTIPELDLCPTDLIQENLVLKSKLAAVTAE